MEIADIKDEDFIEDISLKVVRTGTDNINFKILEMLPTNVGIIMKETGLSKVPVNVRLNQLERVGLIKRWRGTGMIIGTDFEKIFIGEVYKFQNEVRERIMDMLKGFVK